MLQEKLQRWIMSLPDGPAIERVNQHVEQLAEELYSEYEPTKGPYPDFWRRLDLWLNNLADESDQQVFFRLLSDLFFVGPKELDNLYRVAFNETICQWVIDHIALTLDDPLLGAMLDAAIEHTWFCPITDSMRINAFYHLNHLSGRSLRPDWLSLGHFGCPGKIDDFITRRRIERIVLLEDFVGSGVQITPAIEFAGSLMSKIPILVVPLIVCPSGSIELKNWESRYPHIDCRPVLELRDLDFLSSTPQTDEPTLHGDLRRLANSTFLQLLGAQTINQAKVYGPFGFDSTGGLLVLATNCPDNTLPLLHHKSVTWNPLFPRASRV